MNTQLTSNLLLLSNYKDISEFLSSPVFWAAQEFYPDYSSWVLNKIIPGLNSYERKIVTITREKNTIGYVLLKDNDREKKICTIYIAPEFRLHGHGSELFKYSKQILRTNYPHITIPEELIGQFNPLIDQHGFSVSKKVFGEYRTGKTEYHINSPATCE